MTEPHDPRATPAEPNTVSEDAVEAAALATHEADGPRTDGTGTAAERGDDAPTDTQGAAAGDDTAAGDASPDGDVTRSLGGPTSGEDDYVAVNPAGISGEPTAALTADEEQARGETGPEVGARSHGSSGR
ncbi:hypothetical protein EDF38_0696 [Frigoribacterium sp. PhB160]|uniref:hypothetical protein n=1 Tax=Frigoribacterium sp. PhB160 TaxID=2485192 RepID=UPI000F4A7757|nr:hypothetical protein [Frigoribacterium sp. PhB160]ROS61606.1 hypothetical protein EDF38_0696 [Frigoribacterium sp. PhB160]